jgi:kanamycin kinase
VASEFGAWTWSIAWDHDLATTWRLEADDGRVAFAKVGSSYRRPSAADEAPRMEWAHAFLPVPEVLDRGRDGAIDWLVTVGLDGLDAVRHPWREHHPDRLVDALAHALARFHARAPVASCPFDFRVSTALEQVRMRVAGGLVDADEDFHDVHRHLTPLEALAELERSAPRTEDLVVCHGDYCFPNILFDAGGNVTGYVDLGELGVADRWWDLAVATWSIDWNIAPGYGDAFLAAYGARPDPGRSAWYRLLYDLAS